MSQLNFWLKATPYSVGDFVLDGAGNIQQLTAPPGGGTSGSSVPPWTTMTTPDNGLTWTWKGFGGRTRELQKPAGTSLQPFTENFPDAVSFSRSVTGSPPISPDAGKFVLLNASGQIDASMGGGGSGSGFPISTPQLVITGGSVTVTGTGIIEATELATSSVPVVTNINAPRHPGQLLISQPGNASAVWADPLVQGPYATGYPITTQSASIASWSITSNVVTFNAANAWGATVVGSLFAVFGLVTGFYLNGQILVVATVSGTQITASFSHADVALVTESGTAVTGTLNPVPMGGRRTTDGTLQSLTLDASGNLSVIANAGAGTFSVGGTVTANIGTTNGLALDASVNGIIVAQGSLTSGEKGPLVQGAVTTSAPVYTTGQTSPLSLTPAGALRVDGSAVTQPVSIAGTVAENLTQVGGSPVSLGQKTSAASFPVAIASDQSAVPVTLASTTVTNTVAVSGTVAVTQSTNPWSVTFPSPQHVIVDSGGGGGSPNINLIQVNGVALTSPSAFGVVPPASGSPAATSVIPVNASIFAGITGITATGSSLNVNITGSATSSTASAPAQQTIGISSVLILAANAARKEATVVNTGTSVIFLGLGQTPTNTAYHIALQKCTLANDGTGGTYVTDLWTGAINAISSAAGGTVVVTELT